MRRFTRLSVLALGAGALAVGVLAPGASAGIRQDAAPLTIVKTVSGPVPAGTTFTATLQCTPFELAAASPGDGGMINDGGEGTNTAQVHFDATGQPTSPDTFFFYRPGTCTVTETATGGATSTTYACEGTIPDDEEEVPAPIDGVGSFQAEDITDPCGTAGPQAAPITVVIEDQDQDATVTVANTFTAPEQPIKPAAQIVAQPAFTG
jgi:hypothetical protein